MPDLIRRAPVRASSQPIVSEPSPGVLRLLERLAKRTKTIRLELKRRAKAKLPPMSGWFSPKPRFQSWRPNVIKGAARRALLRKRRQVMRRESRRANRA